MKTRSLMTLVVVLCCCALVLGATINREDAGGLWSTVIQWDPNQLPASGDTAVHGTLASGVMTYDDEVPPENRTIGVFTAVAGDNRGLIIDAGLDLEVLGDFTRSSGTGAYVTELLQNSTLIVDGTIVQGDWIVGTGATVEAGAISLGSDTDWEINGGIVDVGGDMFLDPNDADPNNVVTVNNGGELFVGGDGSFYDLKLNAGGSADITGALDATSSVTIFGGTLTAGSAGTTGSTPSLGHFTIRNGGAVTVDGEFRLRSDENAQDRLSYGSSGSNSLNVGSLNFASAGAELAVLAAGGPNLTVTVSGDVDFAITAAARTVPVFNSRRLYFTLDGSSTQDVEVFTPDYDVNSIGVVWQGISKCGTELTYNVMPITELVVGSGATVDLTDDSVNFLRGDYTQDALYVDGDINVPSGATLNADFPVYYTGSRLGTGTINGTAVQVSKVCFGDFDADGDVDTGDFAIVQAAFSGSGSESDNPLCSSNLDGDVDTQDFAVFSQQFTGANNPCPTSCAESGGGGELSIEELAEWCLTYLSSAERESFAETLYALAEAAGETQDAADMAELAYLITAE